MYDLEKDVDFIEYIQEWKDLASLEYKVNHAKKILTHVAKHFAPHEVAVAWTAGKDSTVLLALWREVLATVHPEAQAVALNLDTGHKFPEILAFRDELASHWNITMHIARPDWGALCAGLGIAAVDEYPVAQNHVQCCADLKIRPLETAITKLGVKVLLTGIRADEHAERAKRGMLEMCHKDLKVSKQDSSGQGILLQVASEPQTEHARIHAILAFTEMDVWSYIMSRAIPYCSLYADGYRSLGCMPCTQKLSHMGQGSHGTTGERAGRNAEKEASMQSLHELGYF